MLYDLIVIGGGPAGYIAAERAGHRGLSVLLAEKSALGGVCLNEGCIPTKTLLYSAKLLDNALYSEKYGVTISEALLNHEKVIARKNKVVRTLVAGVGAVLKQSGVQIINSPAVIAGRNESGYVIKTADQEHTARNLLIATGSIPIMPIIKGISEGVAHGYIVTNKAMLSAIEVPATLAVVGGGVVGLEMASYFNSAGSKVTVIELLDHIAGYTDSEISGILMKNYQKKGIKFLLNTKAVEIKEGSVICESKGERFDVKAAKILMSIGRTPATQGIGLETIGVETEKGRIRTDERGRTNVPGVYAAGDVNGVSMLAHTAYREAEVCVNNMLGKNDIMRYNAVPSVIYTNPEVACVGETEESARQKGMDFEQVSLSMRYSGRYVTENEEGDGICKALIDRKYRKLIGLHIIGNSASEIIFGAGIMIETEMTVGDIRECIFPHPTVSEIIREAAFKFD